MPHTNSQTASNTPDSGGASRRADLPLGVRTKIPTSRTNNPAQNARALAADTRTINPVDHHRSTAMFAKLRCRLRAATANPITHGKNTAIDKALVSIVCGTAGNNHHNIVIGM
jgi:hypothetical protein